MGRSDKRLLVGSSSVRHCRLVSLSLTTLCASLGFQLAVSRTAGARLRPAGSGSFGGLVSCATGGGLFSGLVGSAAGSPAGSGLLLLFSGLIRSAAGSATSCRGSHLHIPGSQVLKGHEFVLLA